MSEQDVDFNHTKRIVERYEEAAILALYDHIAKAEGMEVEIEGQPCVIKAWCRPKRDPKEREETDYLYGRFWFGFDIQAKDGSWHIETCTHQCG